MTGNQDRELGGRPDEKRFLGSIIETSLYLEKMKTILSDFPTFYGPINTSKVIHCLTNNDITITFEPWCLRKYQME